MTQFYLDASFLVCLFVSQRKTDSAVAWLTRHTQPIIVSDFAGAEYASAISRLYRNRDLDRESAASSLDDFDDWVVAATTRRLTSPADIAAAERLIRRFELKLQAPDALHIAIALTDEATLVTFDERQAEAMKQFGSCTIPA